MMKFSTQIQLTLPMRKIPVIGIIALLSACATTPEDNKPVAVPLTSAIQKVQQQKKLKTLASQAAYTHGVDRRLFHALINQESAWNPDAISRKGARGLTQLMPLTGKTECGLDHYSLGNPRLNLHCGAYYLGKLLRRFGSVELALAAYNSGETRVARLGRVPRIRETQHYVRKIIENWLGYQ